MIRSPNATSGNGASLTHEVFASILRRADWIERAIFTHDDALGWTRRATAQLVELGLLREIARSDLVRCNDCSESCFVPAELTRDGRTGEMIGFYYCSHEYEGGPKTFDLEEFRRWEFCFDRFAALLAETLGLRAVEPVVPHRVCLLGTLPTGGGPLDVFLACCLREKDAPSVIERAARLRASTAPVVLVWNRPPKRALWQDVRPTVLMISEHVTWNQAESRLDPGTLPDLLRSIRPPLREDDWLTVTDCARMLMKDLPHIELDRAKARVSRAANAGKFTTNGKKRDARRIDRTSFDAWRLEQRDRDLDEEDRGDRSERPLFGRRD